MENRTDSKANTGQIQVIFGPMFSGKTTELMRRIRRYNHANKTCLIIKYRKDTRYVDDDSASTHDRVTFKAKAADQLSEAVAAADGVDVVGVDEGQFFSDLIEHCERWASEGKIVIVAALDGTFQRKPFGNTLELVALAESVTKLQAVCHLCFRDASYSRRLGDETAIEVIGGAEKYVAVCRECYFRPFNAECARPVQASPKKQKIDHGSLPPGSVGKPVAFKSL
eukprot:TRINITY_DN11742_c0_g1_i1.p1 TRINITY_DN11742_c0_g1~~TRINITY_DN11742_c0_g1_i1.p1  ORF type:complete len:225 (-),score=79.29 TRINITY_DN11742_c0_g1_i1:227-901(-)